MANDYGYNNNSQSLAIPQSGFSQYPTQSARQSQGKSGSGSLATSGQQLQSQDGLSFYGGNSFMENAGSTMNLIGSGVSLVSMLRNMRDARKNNETNRENIRDQMARSEEAFNRNVVRQNRSIEGAEARNERVAEMNQ